VPSRPEFAPLLIAVLAAGCGVPEIDIVPDDGGGADVTVEASAEGSGDDGGATEAGDDATGDDGGNDGGDAAEAGACGAAQCCGSIPCSGDCSDANCQTCTSKCGGTPPQQCCVKNGTVGCHPVTSNCP
jgi:hypothetical protein